MIIVHTFAPPNNGLDFAKPPTAKILGISLGFSSVTVNFRQKKIAFDQYLPVSNSNRENFEWP